jgi:hypothetical protein
MNSEARIASIRIATALDSSITAIPTFHLAGLQLPTALDFQLSTKLRLGHLVEKIVGALLQLATNYELLYENTQILEGKKTIGELDFIIKENSTQRVIHLELAYKFYLFDPKISSEPINNWIGPNRNDSLKYKLEKLKTKQFPLLHHDCTRSKLDSVVIDQVAQELCLLVSLFVPFDYKKELIPSYQQAIKGYYVNYETFISQHTDSKTYCLPPKKDWGINPAENDDWINFETVAASISNSTQEKQAPLVWQKHIDSYSEFFVVWW